ncbi:hypothetical protein VSDG_08395 [Cytospora chrysosperma]|uniref:Uncharacterized protein n=1 Tax=Cytospora chrysosperma TaxID=252740 RepID=A0A423VGK6_CYTCH|nr:hypothetical protein VSDG_08395 [Valsa sordida]
MSDGLHEALLSALRAVAISLMRCGSAVGLLCCNLKVDFHIWIPGQVSRDEETAKDVHFEQVFNPWKPRISGLLYYRVSMQVILESLSTIM